MNVGRAGALERFLSEASLRAPVDQPEAARRIGDCDVIGDRKVGNERKLLEDADNAGAIGGGRRIEGDFGSVEENAAGIGRDYAGQDLDQRRFARAAGFGGKMWLYSRPIIISTTSLSVFVPAT